MVFLAGVLYQCDRCVIFNNNYINFNDTYFTAYVTLVFLLHQVCGARVGEMGVVWGRTGGPPNSSWLSPPPLGTCLRCGTPAEVSWGAGASVGTIQRARAQWTHVVYEELQYMGPGDSKAIVVSSSTKLQ